MGNGTGLTTAVLKSSLYHLSERFDILMFCTYTRKYRTFFCYGLPGGDDPVNEEIPNSTKVPFMH